MLTSSQWQLLDGERNQNLRNEDKKDKKQLNLFVLVLTTLIFQAKKMSWEDEII